MLKKILVPVDGSEDSERAVDFAIDLGKKFGAKIIGLHVVEHFKAPKDFQAYASEEGIQNPSVEYARRMADYMCKKMEKKVKAAGLDCSMVIDEGHAVDKIVTQAQNQDVDLIVIGTRGLGAVKRVLVGSVSQGVTTHAHCPVTVVR